MKKIKFYLLLVVLIINEKAYAFKNAEHQHVTTAAIQQFGGNPEFLKYGPTIINWSFGIGTFPLGKPAEQLAHLGIQNRPLSDTNALDGGPFSELLEKAQSQYNQFIFDDETPGNEGAYVLLGSCSHLIEDQSSMPHAANVIHGFSDNFETVFAANGSWDGARSYTDSSSAYLDSLNETQATVLGLRSLVTRLRCQA